ncbi:MAG: DUF2970 domain-containing protein [Cycloclasticus sp.]|nr:DUF2970 domain-containing protein [Cycloclasticus sp.]
MKNDKASYVNQAPSLLQIITSTMMSFIGVSSPSRRARDFQHGNPEVFFAVGFIMLVLFVLSVSTVVQFVLPNG